MEKEDNFHPFVKCQFGRDVYLAMSEVWELPALELMEGIGKEWLLHVLAPLSEFQRGMVLLIFWRSWYVRNHLVHSKPAPPLMVSMRFLQDYVASLSRISDGSSQDLIKGKQSLCFNKAPTKRDGEIVPAVPWKPPLIGWVKLNTDGSYSEDAGAGAGMILRDYLGAIVFSSCRTLYSCRDPPEVELRACMEGISFAIQRSNLPILIEMDSSTVVAMISSVEPDRSISQNRASNRLANFGRIEGRTMTWVRIRREAGLPMDPEEDFQEVEDEKEEELGVEEEEQEPTEEATPLAVGEDQQEPAEETPPLAVGKDQQGPTRRRCR
ncbi:Long chain acyl-CoA synthetase 9, chloroplastic [Hordeum vulgare]|nr:Long chain acyl-CoA synthetase 9, chloroplastic [Hordeum vulgare]